VVGLSNHAFRLEAPFDRLRTNGKSQSSNIPE
jgi:hypothetical protein